MVEQPVNMARWRLFMPGSVYDQLHGHLFPGDGDEHAAVLLASMVQTPRGVHLLARELYLAQDLVDFAPSPRAYRMLRAEFITNTIRRARHKRLVHLAIHNHGGKHSVAFSQPDLTSHEKGYPSLLKIAKGIPVGALVFAENAVAADIWLADGQRLCLDEMRVIGTDLKRLYSSPRIFADTFGEQYDRQSRLFGPEGQTLLDSAKVGIIGLGGAGSQIAHNLAKIGVGEFVLIDPDRVEVSNVPRLVGATGWHARSWIAKGPWPEWLKRLGRRTATPKVRLSKSIIKKANKKAKITSVQGDVCIDENIQMLADCDYVFLAADSHTARLAVNEFLLRHLIPGVQVGAKISRHPKTGVINDIYSVVRPILPDIGCLYCNGLISPAKLQQEGCSEEELDAQNYGLGSTGPSASITTLNAVTAAHAANDFMIWFLGLQSKDWHMKQFFYHAHRRSARTCQPRKDPRCPFCSNSHGIVGLGRLPHETS